MDESAARALIDLTTRFYRENAASFARTRGTAWAGWQRLVPFVQQAARPTEDMPDGTCSVLDLACGNLRFERFLAAALPETRFTFHAVDNCPELADGSPLPTETIYHAIDVLDALLGSAAGDVPSATPDAAVRCAGKPPLAPLPACDLVCCFGFMHHVPSFELRAAVLQELVRHTAPDGIVAVSFWQFMHDERLAAKATAAIEAARTRRLLPPAVLDAFEPGDHLLGWQDSESLRYCHHFEEDEIDRLIAALPGGAMRELERYSADGRSGDLNRYIILQRTARPEPSEIA